MHPLVRLSGVAAAALFLLLVFSSADKVFAADFIVDSNADTPDAASGNGVCADSLGACTLRAAIQEANAFAGDDTIYFTATGTINLTAALPDLASNITITGPGTNVLTVRRNTGGDYRILTVNSGTVSVSGVTLTNGKTADGVAGDFGGRGGDGGGILNFGTLTLTNVVVTANSTGRGGDGITSAGGGGFGGGIYSLGTLTMVDCVVSQNSGGRVGDGGSFNTTGGSGGGIYHNNGTMTLTNVTVSDNHAGDDSDTGTNGNFAGHGGGLYIGNFATVEMTGCTVSGNSAGQSAQGTDGYAGGIENSGELTVVNSTVSGNTATNSAGGILNRNILTMTNSTVSGNRILDTGDGGGINSDIPSTLKLTNCTITDNTAGVGSAQGVASYTSNAQVANTIIAGNGAGPDTSGNFNSQGYNLVGYQSGFGTGFGVTGDQVGTSSAPLDPRLGPLVLNGGPTLTHAPLVGSTAIDAGNDALAKDAGGNTLTTDQRGAGFPRFIDSLDSGTAATVDIGAAEADLFLEDVTDKTTNEDTFIDIPFGLKGQIGMSASASDPTLVPTSGFFFLVTGPETRTLQITPAANRFGSTTITLNVHGPQGQILSDTFMLTVTAVNDFPLFTKGADHVVNEDAGAQTVAAWASGISAGPNESGQTLTFVVQGNTNSGLFSAGPAVNPSGTLTYTPAANANGVAQINLALMDNGGTANGGVNTSPGQVFNIVVNAVNDAPAANAQTLTTDEDTAKSVTLTGSDVEGSSLTFNVTTQPSHGTLTGTGATRTYTPQANYTGADSFKFRTNDGQANSAEATVTITVSAVNDAPVNSVPGAQTTSQNGARVFSAANANAVTVSDVDAGTGAVRLTLTAANGTLTLATTAGLAFTSGDGTNDSTMTFSGTVAAVNAALNGLSFKPNTGFSGAASLQLTTNDLGRTGTGGAKSDTDTVAINVLPGGALQFSAATYEVNESATTVNVTVTRTGGSAGAASVIYNTSPGSASAGASCGSGVDYLTKSGTLSWANGDTASKTFAVTICNDSLHESDETVNLTLSGAAGSATLGVRSSAVLTLRDDDPAGGVFEFSSAAYGVAEGAGSRIIAVRRTGDTTRAATVEYATDDGSSSNAFVPCDATAGRALDRCDFTKAAGRLSFAAGETQKTFTLLINDDAYTEGAETVTLRLSNPGGSASLGARSTATLTIADDVPETTTNPLDNSRKFVAQHYNDFLNRPADAAGLNFWAEQIDACGADAACVEARRINVSAAFFLSGEFQGTGYFVYLASQAAHATGPTLRIQDFLPDSQAVGLGVVDGAPGASALLEQNKRAYLDEFVARTAFLTRYPLTMPKTQFVDLLNANAGGALSQEERDTLVSELTAGTKTRAEVLRAVIEDPHFDALEKNRAFVLMQYFGYMRRNPPDPPELNLNFDGYFFWLDKLEDHGGNFVSAEMVKAFITSGEYRQRFGQ